MSLRPRLLPIVIGAASGLLVLKLVGALIGDEGAVTGTSPVAAQQAEVAKEDTEKFATDKWEKPENPTDRRAEADGLKYEQGTSPNGDAQAALLERLGERRKQLDALENELLERENLLKAAEQKVEKRISELRAIEENINATIQKRDDEEKARFEGLIKMYEAMKPKDAARIFDRLDLKILVDVAARIAPDRMGEIMAKMQPQVAEQLTVALVLNETARAKAVETSDTPAELPKIVGQVPKT